MSITPVQASLNSTSSTTKTSVQTLEKQENDLQNQIKSLQDKDPDKNADQIKSLQQQALALEAQILQQQQSTSTSTSSTPSGPPAGKPPAGGKVGPAYTVNIGKQAAASAAKDTSKTDTE